MKNAFRNSFLVIVLLLFLAGCVRSDSSVPSSFRGFVGSVQGEVLSVQDTALILKLNRIVEIREDNRSPRPGVAEGHEFVVHPRRVIDRQGRAHPNSDHASFITTLSSGDVVTIRVKHLSGNQLELLSLTSSQKRRLHY